MLRLDAVEPSTLELLKRIQALPEFSDTRLVGGTSLALQLGHRVSIDLDLFGSWPAEADLLSALRRIGITRKSSGTPGGKMQFFYVDDIKVDCVTYDMFPWRGAFHRRAHYARPEAGELFRGTAAASTSGWRPSIAQPRHSAMS